MNKERMMQGMVGCRMRAMDEVGNTTTIQAEETVYTNQDHIITAEEETRDGKMLKWSGIKKK